MPGISRRRFIEGSLATTVGLTLSGNASGAKADVPDVVEVRGKSIEAMVDRALEALGGISRFVTAGKKVVLKPNAAFPNPPSWGSTTHPEVVVAVAKACLASGAAEVTVVEHAVRGGKRCLRRSGIGPAVERVEGLRLQILGNPEDFEEVKIEGGYQLESVDVAKVVRRADVLINLPVAKSHGSALVSFGLKNAMGLIRDRRAFHGKYDLHEAIADLARVVRPQLTLIDATRVLRTNGPAGPGDTVQPERIIGSADTVAADALALSVARFDDRQLVPNDVPHIRKAAAAGLGQANLSALRVLRIEA